MSKDTMRSMNKYNRHVGIIAYPQVGRGMRPFPTSTMRPPTQRGGGIKSFARRAGRRFRPVAKDIGKQLLKAGLSEADGLVRDIESGKNLKRTLKTRGKRLGKRALNIGKTNIRKVFNVAKQLGRGRGRVTKTRKGCKKKRQKGGRGFRSRPPPFIGSWDDNNVFA